MAGYSPVLTRRPFAAAAAILLLLPPPAQAVRAAPLAQSAIRDLARVTVNGTRQGVACSLAYRNKFDGLEYAEVFFPGPLMKPGTVEHVLTDSIRVDSTPAEDHFLKLYVEPRPGYFGHAVRLALERYAELPLFGERRGEGDAGGAMEWWSYASVRLKADHVLKNLAQNGLGRGDRVVILGENCIEFAVVMIACFMGGYTPALLHHHFSDDSIRRAMQDMQPGAAFADKARLLALANNTGVDLRLLVAFQPLSNGMAEAIAAFSPRASVASFDEMLEGRLAGEGACTGSSNSSCPPIPQPSWVAETAFLLYTSGSTGHPKGTRISNQVLTKRLSTLGARPQSWATTQNHFMSASGTAHDLLTLLLGGGRIAIYRPLEDMFSVTRVVWPNVVTFTPAMLNTLYAQYQGDLADARMPQQRVALWRHYSETMGPRLLADVHSSGAKSNPAVMRWVERLLNVTTLENYGSTEAGFITARLRDGQYCIWEDGLEVRLRDYGDYKTTDEPPRGELLLKSPTLFAGYVDPNMTAKAFDKDGFYKTGDIVKMVANDCNPSRGPEVPIVIDRKKSTFKLSSMVWVSPAEIEHRLEEGPLVYQAFVYGDSTSSNVVALIVPTADAFKRIAGNETLEEAVLRDVTEAATREPALRHFEVPARVHLVSEPFKHNPADKENDLMTVTEKKNRVRIAMKYRRDLADLMASLAN
jgi:fatty acid CoA ligase FadD9